MLLSLFEWTDCSAVNLPDAKKKKTSSEKPKKNKKNNYACWV